MATPDPFIMGSSGRPSPFTQVAAALLLTKSDTAPGINWARLRSNLEILGEMLTGMDTLIEDEKSPRSIVEALQPERAALASLINYMNWLSRLAQEAGAEQMDNAAVMPPLKDDSHFYRHFLIAEILYRDQQARAYDNLSHAHREIREHDAFGVFSQVALPISPKTAHLLLATQGSDPAILDPFDGDDISKDGRQDSNSGSDDHDV